MRWRPSTCRSTASELAWLWLVEWAVTQGQQAHACSFVILQADFKALRALPQTCVELLVCVYDVKLLLKYANRSFAKLHVTHGAWPQTCVELLMCVCDTKLTYVTCSFTTQHEAHRAQPRGQLHLCGADRGDRPHHCVGHPLLPAATPSGWARQEGQRRLLHH